MNHKNYYLQFLERLKASFASQGYEVTGVKLIIANIIIFKYCPLAPTGSVYTRYIVNFSFSTHFGTNRNFSGLQCLLYSVSGSNKTIKIPNNSLQIVECRKIYFYSYFYSFYVLT